LNGFFAFLTVPPAPPFPEHLHMKKMCGVVWAYAGPQDKSRKKHSSQSALSRSLRSILWDRCRKPALQSMFDAIYPPGLQW